MVNFTFPSFNNYHFFKLTLFGLFFLVIAPTNFSQKLPEWNEMNINGSEKISSDRNEVIHFFATWCKPCMQELPIFDTLRTMYSSEKLELTFVCMDLKNSKKMKKKINKLNLPGHIYYLEPTQKSVQSINPNWKGELPASIIYLPNNKGSELFEGAKNVSFYLKYIEK